MAERFLHRANCAGVPVAGARMQRGFASSPPNNLDDPAASRVYLSFWPGGLSRRCTKLSLLAIIAWVRIQARTNPLAQAVLVEPGVDKRQHVPDRAYLHPLFGGLPRRRRFGLQRHTHFVSVSDALPRKRTSSPVCPHIRISLKGGLAPVESTLAITIY
jgi:hypothetical protein